MHTKDYPRVHNVKRNLLALTAYIPGLSIQTITLLCLDLRLSAGVPYSGLHVRRLSWYVRTGQ